MSPRSPVAHPSSNPIVWRTGGISRETAYDSDPRSREDRHELRDRESSVFRVFAGGSFFSGISSRANEGVERDGLFAFARLFEIARRCFTLIFANAKIFRASSRTGRGRGSTHFSRTLARCVGSYS